MRLMTLVSLLLLWPHAGHSAEAGFPLYEMRPDLEDKGSLQRGAKIYMNYCLGCHSLQYQRYKRTAVDLGVPESLMLEHLVFDPNTKIGDTITSAQDPASEMLPGYKEVRPMVFSGLYPLDTNDYEKLKKSVGKLRLNDAAFTYHRKLQRL